MEMTRLKNNMYKLIIVLIALLTCGLAYSQSISIESCTLVVEDNTTNDTETQVLDQNGERCALLKIQTSETGFSFDVGSLGIIKTVEQPNEIWLYVPYGIKKISVYHPIFENLKDYQFPSPIRSGNTYLISLKITFSFAPNTGSLEILTNIDGASVFLDGHEIGVTPLSKMDVSKGNHNIIVKSNGYALFSKNVTIDERCLLKLTETLSKKNLMPIGMINATSNCTRTYRFKDNKALIRKNSEEHTSTRENNFNGIYFVQMYGVIDKDGIFIEPFSKNDDYYYHDKYYQDETTNSVNHIYADSKNLFIWNFNSGLARVSELLNSKSKYGYVNDSHKLVIPLIWENADDFSEDYAKVEREKRTGYINTSGKEVIPCIYEQGRSFKEGLAAVKVNGKWGYINKHGDIVIDCEYDDVNDFSEGYAFVRKGAKWGFIDKTGHLLTPFIYNSCEDSDFHEGMAVVHIGDKWGYVNKYGNDTF